MNANAPQTIGRYRIVEELARGGMGIVYRAHASDGRTVALKLLLAHRANSEHARKRFHAEVKTLAKLRHPHVVPILDAGEHQGCPWLVLEFVEGQSLDERLRAGPLPVEDVVRYGVQLAQALAYVHRCGVLHRDLKPANVLVRGEQALLTDFGLARDADASYSRITRSGVFMGTPGFWAPEQAEGRLSELGPHTDAYGFGALLFACLTGRPPVQGTTLTDFLGPGSFSRIPPPRKLRKDVPAWLNALCLRCLAVDPSERPASADELARELLVESSKPRAPRGRTSRRTRGQPRSRIPTVLLTFVAPGVLGIVGGAYMLTREKPEPASAALEFDPEGNLEFGEEDGSGFGFDDDPSDDQALLTRRIPVEASTGVDLVDDLVNGGVSVAVHPDVTLGPLNAGVTSEGMDVRSALDFLAASLDVEWSLYSGVAYLHPKEHPAPEPPPLDPRYGEIFERTLELNLPEAAFVDVLDFLTTVVGLRVQTLAVPGGASLDEVSITLRGESVTVAAALGLIADQVGAKWRIERDGSVTFIPPR